MKRNLLRLQLAALIIMAGIVLALGQTAANSTVEERSVRAAMNFLASDAMQGRGSGTAFERITAEYVGSHFMQFGLEPAGEIGWDGRPGYVQTVTISRNSFASAPVLRYGGKPRNTAKRSLRCARTQAKLAERCRRSSSGERSTQARPCMFGSPPTRHRRLFRRVFRH